MENVELICTDIKGNHNKFYRMVQLDSRSFKATWGRVGGTESNKIYPMQDWDRIYREKTTVKGYRDVTHLAEQPAAPPKKMQDVRRFSDPELEGVVSKMTKEAEDEYREGMAISKARMQAANRLLIDLSAATTVREANTVMEQLLAVLPRRVQDLRKYAISSLGQKVQRVAEERRRLDSLMVAVAFSGPSSPVMPTVSSGNETALVTAVRRIILLEGE